MLKLAIIHPQSTFVYLFIGIDYNITFIVSIISWVHIPLKYIAFKWSVKGSTPLIMVCQYGELVDSVQHIVECWGVDVKTAATYYSFMVTKSQHRSFRLAIVVEIAFPNSSDSVVCLSFNSIEILFRQKWFRAFTVGKPLCIIGSSRMNWSLRCTLLYIACGVNHEDVDNIGHRLATVRLEAGTNLMIERSW